MKKRITGLLLVLSVAVLAGAASAQDTIGIYADFGEGGGLESAGITKPGTPFDIVVVADPSEDHGAMEFVMTELMHLYGGVFKYSTHKINDTTLDLGDNQAGEYLMAYGCTPAGEQEMVRIRYYDLNGEIGENVVLQLSGFGPDASKPSSFDGGMGYASCAMGKVELTAVPWDVASTQMDPARIPGIASTDGIVVLNPAGLSVPNDGSSMGLLKSRY